MVNNSLVIRIIIRIAKFTANASHVKSDRLRDKLAANTDPTPAVDPVTEAVLAVRPAARTGITTLTTIDAADLAVAVVDILEADLNIVPVLRHTSVVLT
jgi:hypothetical protein